MNETAVIVNGEGELNGGGPTLPSSPADPLRILHLIAPSRISGAERIVADLCVRLKGRGHEVLLGCKFRSPFTHFARQQGLECLELNINGKVNPLAVPRIMSVLRKRKIDLVNTHLSTASLWGSLAGRLAGVPVVADVQALNTKTCYLFADRITTCSQAVKQHLCYQGIPENRIDVVYNAVDLKRFCRTLPPREAKISLGLADNCFLVGVIAHLSEKKGHRYLLSAAEMIIGKHPNLRLAFIGEGAYRQELESLSRSLGLADSVLFGGYQPDVRPYLNAMDVLVLPSIAKEGFGIVLAEAGAMAVPAIATTVGGAQEVVEQGETGFVVPPADVEALANAIIKLIEDPALRDAMGRRAQERIRSRFGSELMVSNMERVYNDLVNSRRGRKNCEFSLEEGGR